MQAFPAGMLAFLVAGCLALAGCAGGGDGTSTSTTTTTTPTQTTTSDTGTTVTYTTTIGGSTTTITSTITTTLGTETEGPVPPVIENITVTPSSNGAVITWNVTEGKSPVSSWVEYDGINAGNYSKKGSEQFGLGQKSWPITTLSSCSGYKYRIAARDGAGTTLRTPGEQFQTTTGPGLSIALSSIENILDTEFTVRWNVVGPTDAVSWIEYGTTAAYGSKTADLVGNGAKVAKVSGLTADQTYNFRLKVKSPYCSTEATSGNNIQKTALVKHVDIVGNLGPASFDPGLPPAKPLDVPAGRPIVWDITNQDAVSHTWLIEGATPAYGSPTITADNTYHFPVSITLAAGSHTMRCSIHSGMTGTITAA